MFLQICSVLYLCLFKLMSFWKGFIRKCEWAHEFTWQNGAFVDLLGDRYCEKNKDDYLILSSIWYLCCDHSLTFVSLYLVTLLTAALNHVRGITAHSYSKRLKKIWRARATIWTLLKTTRKTDIELLNTHKVIKDVENPLNDRSHFTHQLNMQAWCNPKNVILYLLFYC